jgi:hypothetical protein
VEANSTGGQGSRRAVAPSNDDDDDDDMLIFIQVFLDIKLEDKRFYTE